jgi:DNA-binding NarL/FixJ family response regulator
MASPPSLLVVDGHAGVRQALAGRLHRAPSIGAVHVAGTLHEAVALARTHAPHLAICDPRTVGEDIADVVRLLRREVRHVLVLTTSLLDHEHTAVREAGSAAVLLKGGETARLLEAIAALADG